jgi:hypothetical protein
MESSYPQHYRDTLDRARLLLSLAVGTEFESEAKDQLDYFESFFKKLHESAQQKRQLIRNKINDELSVVALGGEVKPSAKRLINFIEGNA